LGKELALKIGSLREILDLEYPIFYIETIKKIKLFQNVLELFETKVGF